MQDDPIRGEILRFAFEDGPMAHKAFDHTFDANGEVTFHAVGHGTGGAAGDRAEKPVGGGAARHGVKYELARVRENVFAVSYVSAGYTLTTILDFETGRLVSFSSNEKGVSTQRGKFEVLGPATNGAQKRRETVAKTP